MLIDDYAWRSPLRAWHPTEKLQIVLAALLISLFCSWPAVNLLVFAGFSLVIVKWGQVKLRDYGLLLAMPAFFLLAGVLTVLITYQPTLPVIWDWRIGGTLWGVTYQGLAQAELVATRALGMVAAMYWLALTTPIVELTSAGRSLGLPETINDLIYLVYRGIYLLTGVAEQIVRAQSLRLGYGDWKNGFNSGALLTAAMFSHSLRRSHEMTTAMLARGPAGRLPAVALRQTICRTRVIGCWLAAAVGLAVMVIIR